MAEAEAPTAASPWLLADVDPPRPGAVPPRDPAGLASWPNAFALAWRDGDGALRLARDPVGHRSLFWARRPDGEVVAGTRLRDVVARRGTPVRIDTGAVTDYLSYAYVPGTRTLVEGVSAVAPGTALRLSDAGPEDETAFACLPAEPDEFQSEEELRVSLRRALEDAVGAAIPAGPVAASLSGGIDSSLVVALARRFGVGSLQAFSVSFGGEHRDELAWSSWVARHCGVTHEVVVVTPERVRERFDPTVRALSEPNGDPLTVPNDLLFQAARAHAPYLLNGEGGDPCFGGPKNAPMLLAELYGSGEREDAYLLAHQRCFEDLRAMLEPGIDPDGPRRAVRAWFRDPRWPTFLNRLMAINIVFKGAWHILPKVEHLGALHGVTPRSPLFAWPVVELSTRIPGPLKRAGSVEKHLLKEAVRDLLPKEVVERPKSGMMVPVEAWFSGPLKGWARERLLDGGGLGGLVRRPWLEDLVSGRLAGLRPRRGIKIWQLLTLETWIRGIREAAPSGEPPR